MLGDKTVNGPVSRGPDERFIIFYELLAKVSVILGRKRVFCFRKKPLVRFYFSLFTELQCRLYIMCSRLSLQRLSLRQMR